MNEVIHRLARRLGFVTLETRRSDSLDFHDVAVWQVKEALEAAYEAGVQAGRKEMPVESQPHMECPYCHAPVKEADTEGRFVNGIQPTTDNSCESCNPNEPDRPVFYGSDTEKRHDP